LQSPHTQTHRLPQHGKRRNEQQYESGARQGNNLPITRGSALSLVPGIFFNRLSALLCSESAGKHAGISQNSPRRAQNPLKIFFLGY
jgi:hypothetical protein